MRISDWSSDVCSSDLADRISVRRLACDAIVARDIFRGLDHARDHAIALSRLRHQPRAGQTVVKLDAAEARALAKRGRIMLDVRHAFGAARDDDIGRRSEEHTSELQALMRNSYAD